MSFLVRVILTLRPMTTPWKLELCVDAAGHDETRVRIAPVGPDRSPYLLVTTGAVIVHCLGPVAVMSTAEAWAAARVRASDWLPADATARRTEATSSGVVYPVGSVLFDGRQPWNLSTAGAGLNVTVGCLQVRVRDWTALDTHVRVWAQACDLAVRAFPGKTVTFGRLVEQARISSIQRAAGETGATQDRRRGRGRS
ncbi:MAG: hypothetical protein JWM02_1307 [Frankiales bacterium]|nr:hypothetical protein [Frankiales bacterium]